MTELLPAETDVYGKATLRIAYAIQNTQFDLASDVGIPITVKSTSRSLQELGHAVHILQLRTGRSVTGVDYVSSPDAPWDAALGLTGTRPFRLLESGVRRLQRELRLPYFAFFDSYRFYEACCRCLSNYDLCHEHNNLLSIGAALACAKMRVPYVLTMDADPMLELEVLGRPLRRLPALVAAWEASMTYRLATKIVCFSRAAKRHLTEKWHVDPRKISVIPLGVSTELFSRSYEAQAIRSDLGLYDAAVVMFVGSFQHWHGLDHLVEGFARVSREFPEAKLLLVGDGPARAAVERKIAQLGIGDRASITGIVPHDSVPGMLAFADVVVAPYPHLPQDLWFSPLKLYEYMAAAKAIVASSAGQIAEVLQDGYSGLLVEPGNVQELSRAIIRLLRDEDLRVRLGHNARREAVEKHSWQSHAQKLEELYYSVLS